MSTVEFSTIAIIACILCTSFMVAVILDIYVQVIKCRKSEIESMESQEIRIIVLIYVTLFLIIFLLICAALAFIFASNDIIYNLTTRIWFSSFHVTRSLLYLIFLNKMIIMYNDTIIPFNINTHKYILYVLTFIYVIVYLLIPLTISIITQCNPHRGCIFVYRFSFQYTSSILYIFITVYLLYLFIHPLRQMIKAQLECNPASEPMNHVLRVVMTKYTLLYSVSMISAIVLIIFCMLFPYGYNYTLIDVFINGLLLILLSPSYNTIYKYLCCILHPLCVHYICETQDDALQQTHIEIECLKQDANPKPDDNLSQDRVLANINVNPKTLTPENERAISVLFTPLGNMPSDDQIKKSYTDLTLSTPRCDEIIDFKSYQKSFLGSGDKTITEEEFNSKSSQTVKLFKLLSTNL